MIKQDCDYFVIASKIIYLFMVKKSLKPAKGKLLISKPFLHDPYFKRSVVFLTEHNKDGTVGFILNKDPTWSRSRVKGEMIWLDLGEVTG